MNNFNSESEQSRSNNSFSFNQDDFEDSGISEQVQNSEFIDVTNAPADSKFFGGEITRQLINFFSNKEFIKRINKMCSENKESIKISFDELHPFHSQIEDNFESFSLLLNDALLNLVTQKFPNYTNIKPQVFARVSDLPVIETVRSLRSNHLNKLVRIVGVVTRRSTVFSDPSIIKFTCMKCTASFGPFFTNIKPSTCFECQSKGPFLIDSKSSVYKDLQRITVQEVPSKVPQGSLPRSIEVILTGDLVDSSKPGDEVDIVGVYKNFYSQYAKSGYPTFSTVIEASSVSTSFYEDILTDDDIREIRYLSKDKDIISRIVHSIAPSICGHDNIKKAIACSLFGGVPKDQAGHRIRGDINVLLLGDPGTAKSQFLRQVSSINPRCVLATGQGASAVGLTASVRRDPAVGEWILEGGALVLADNGMCCIDEFDKMSDKDRTSIHEAMEQQSVSVSKAGIVASLNARCSVIAAANPTRGTYNSALSFSQNVNLTDPIVSRFDILCVVKDVIDVDRDSSAANFIIDSHIRSATSNAVNDNVLFDEKENNVNVLKKVKVNDNLIDSDLLRKYFLYAKANYRPEISLDKTNKISKLYSDLRRCDSGVPITIRHVESIVRVSQSFAKMRLSNEVSVEDIDMAISLSLDSFISAQKYSVCKKLRNRFGGYLDKNDSDLVLYLLSEMFNEKVRIGIDHNYVSVDEFEKRLNEFSTTTDYVDSEFFLKKYVINDSKIMRRND